MLKLGELSEVSFGKYNLSELGEVSFGMWKLMITFQYGAKNSNISKSKVDFLGQME